MIAHKAVLLKIPRNDLSSTPPRDFTSLSLSISAKKGLADAILHSAFLFFPLFYFHLTPLAMVVTTVTSSLPVSPLQETLG